MNRLGLIGLMAGAVSSIFAATATAEEVSEGTAKTYMDGDMGRRLFAISMDMTDNHLTVHRGMSDDVVGFVCEWKASGDRDPDTGEVSSVVFEDLGCSADREVPPEWREFEELDIRGWISGTRSVYQEGFITVEVSETVPNSDRVQSFYERAWNIDAGLVCVTSGEGQYDDDGVFETYLATDRGCYEIPEGFYYPGMLLREIRENTPAARP